MESTRSRFTCFHFLLENGRHTVDHVPLECFRAHVDSHQAFRLNEQNGFQILIFSRFFFAFFAEDRKMVYYTAIPLMMQSDHQAMACANGDDMRISHLSNNQNETQLYNISSSNTIDNNKSMPMETGTSMATLTTLQPTTRPASNKPQYKCDQCNMFFGSKSAHTSHIKSHAKANNGQAASRAVAAVQSGGGGGVTATPVTAPTGASASSDPYQCDVCKKTFAVPARLVRHYRTHTGERPFECEFCHKMFSVKENLQVHRRIHTKERPYKCDVCGRAFEHSGKLHRHMRIHTGERPHKCSVCAKTFIQSGQLVIHMRTHTGKHYSLRE